MNYDKIFINGHIYNTALERFYDGFIAVKGDKIAYIGEGAPGQEVAAASVVDLQGKWIVPGLIDIHMHIESSMLTPCAYAMEAVRHGVTTIVSEPHEIANVAGVPGILAMVEAGKSSPIDIYYGIPSCVPSTDSSLETAGADIDVPQVLELLENPNVKCLGEVMNTNAVLNDPDSKTNRLIKAFREAAPSLPVEGHVPRITGEKLAAYLMSGVDSDHTEHNLQEMKERWFNGFCVQVQEKMLLKDVIDYLVQNELYHYTCLVTDDVMANEMRNHGVLDHVLRGAVKLGMPVEKAVLCSTSVPALRMRLWDRGELRPGKLADFVILKDAESFDVCETYKNGISVYNCLSEVHPTIDCSCFSPELRDSIILPQITEDSFKITTLRSGETLCRVARVFPHKTQTEETIATLPASSGEIVFEGSGICQFSVMERHGKNGNVSHGLVDGSVITKGAVATTYSHDSHNLCVLGTNKSDMALAANTVRDMKGGIAVVCDGVVISKAALPIAGILTDKNCEDFADEIGKVTESMRQLGYNHDDPIMSLCVLALPVSPQLKFTDFGLVDVTAQKLVPLEV